MELIIKLPFLRIPKSKKKLQNFSWESELSIYMYIGKHNETNFEKPGIFITWEKHITMEIANHKLMAHNGSLTSPSSNEKRYLLRNSKAYHPCMAYLPTFTIKTQPNEVNIPVPWILCERPGTWEVFGEKRLHMHRPASLQLHLPMS